MTTKIKIIVTHGITTANMTPWEELLSLPEIEITIILNYHDFEIRFCKDVLVKIKISWWPTFTGFGVSCCNSDFDRLILSIVQKTCKWPKVIHCQFRYMNVIFLFCNTNIRSNVQCDICNIWFWISTHRACQCFIFTPFRKEYFLIIP